MTKKKAKGHKKSNNPSPTPEICKGSFVEYTKVTNEHPISKDGGSCEKVKDKAACIGFYSNYKTDDHEGFYCRWADTNNICKPDSSHPCTLPNPRDPKSALPPWINCTASPGKNISCKNVTDCAWGRGSCINGGTHKRQCWNKTKTNGSLQGTCIFRNA